MGIQKHKIKLRLISWNMNHSAESWPFLLSSDTMPDVALLQEALKPKRRLPWSTPAIEDCWQIQGYDTKFCSAVVGFSDRIKGSPLAVRRLGDPREDELVVSQPGTIAVARVSLENGEKVTLISAYSTWAYTFPKKRPIFADASAHRLVSDISALIPAGKGHKVIVAGDWNLLYGYGENRSQYWKGRYETVFTRMKAIGLPFVGPQYPGGIQAHPWPTELPPNSKNVPTFRTRKDDSASATRQLDFVFASSALHDRLAVRALNGPDEWGPSDHCRIAVDLY